MNSGENLTMHPQVLHEEGDDGCSSSGDSLPFAIEEHYEHISEPIEDVLNLCPRGAPGENENENESASGTTSNQPVAVTFESPLMVSTSDYILENVNIDSIMQPELERSQVGNLSSYMPQQHQQHQQKQQKQQQQQQLVSNNVITPTIQQTYSKDTNKSLNFSTLMQEADANSYIINAASSYQKFVGSTTNVNTDEDASASARARARQPLSQVMNKISRTEVQKLSSNTFQVSVPLVNATLREAMNVVSNPDLLRFWDESIENLIVTDYKGGAGMGMTSTSTSTSSYSMAMDEQQKMKYHEPNVEDFDDDMIVPPMVPVDDNTYTCNDPQYSIGIINANTNTNTQRECYDGEWIQASTSEIISPRSHRSIIDDCARSARNMLGFGQYGSVSMFVERNLNQVSFTVGPFKAGVSLSHKIMVREIDMEMPEANADNNSNSQPRIPSLQLIDEVKVMNAAYPWSDQGSSGSCSCFDPIKEIWLEWFTPGIPVIDGYVHQAEKSLLNLADLISRGGDVSGGQLISSPEQDVQYQYESDSLRTPFLQ